MAEVTFRNIVRRYGGVTALDSVNVTAPDRGFTVFSGPPGAGKSTLLRLLVGLEQPDAGAVLINGREVTGLPPAARPVGYVPQSFALYPHLTVAKNIGYPLRLAGAPAGRIAEQVARISDMLAIGHLLDKTPDQLSGGEKQRVAVARGLSKDARVFVLDDPLVGLDYKLRERLMDDLKGLRAELDATFLYATSDPLEALTMAREIVVMEAGRVVQHGPVAEVYAAPACAAALRLTGFPRANLAPGVWRDGRVEAGPLRFATPGGASARDVLVGLRPEALAGGDVTVEGEVMLVEELGSERVVYLDCADYPLTMACGAEGADAPPIGARLRLGVRPQDLVLFDAASGARIGRGEAP